MSLAQSIASAIQQQEGYGTPGAVTITANNNPGAIRSWPGYPSRNGFAVFPDYETGFQVLTTDVQTNIDRGLTLSQFINKYAPSGDNNTPSSYISFVSSQVGINPDVPMNAAASAAAQDSGTLDVSTVLQDLTNSGGGFEAGTIDWGMIAMVGIGGLVLWLIFKD